MEALLIGSVTSIEILSHSLRLRYTGNASVKNLVTFGRAIIYQTQITIAIAIRQLSGQLVLPRSS